LVGTGVVVAFRRFGEQHVDESAFPVDLSGAIELGQAQVVQLEPNASLLPPTN
jgi:hypothetical protein